MGIDDWDNQRGSRSQAPRRRGSYDGSEPPAERSYQRGRPRDYDEQPPSRSSGHRGYGRDDDPRSSSSGRYVPGGADRSGSDRRPRSDQSGAGRRPRSDRDDDTAMRRERRGPSDPNARGASSGRGPRPPVRDEWETSARPRGGSRSPADAGARSRRPGGAGAAGRGGLWGDEPLGDGRRSMMDARDPRARRGQAQAEEEESSGGAAFGKALLAIVLALVIGAGAAYGYYLYSTPKIPANVSQPNSTPSSGSSGASLTPHTTLRNAQSPAVFSAASHTFIVLASS